MATSIQSLNFAPLGSDGANRVATVVLDSAVDTLFNINNSGTGTGSDDARNIPIRWVLLDNLRNNGYVTITMGNFTLNIPPYQRENIAVPDGTRVFAVQLNVGVVGITFSETRLADNQSDALLVQSTAVKTLIYQYVQYSATTGQIESDLNTNTLFSPLIANMAYNLMPISAVSNGWFQFISNQGSKNVSIIPDGLDVINSTTTKQYTSVAPLVLVPGDSGYLTSDGVRWFFQGYYKDQWEDDTLPIAGGNMIGNIFMGDGTATPNIILRGGLTGQGFIQFTNQAYSLSYGVISINANQNLDLSSTLSIDLTPGSGVVNVNAGAGSINAVNVRPKVISYPLPVGYDGFFRVNGGAIPLNGTVAGVSIGLATANSAGVLQSSAVQAGVWRNVGGTTLGSGSDFFGVLVRIA